MANMILVPLDLLFLLLDGRFLRHTGRGNARRCQQNGD
jgi:hypothetical protein